MSDFTEEQLAKIAAAIDQGYFAVSLNSAAGIKQRVLTELRKPPTPVLEKDQLYLFRDVETGKEWYAGCWGPIQAQIPTNVVERRLPNRTELGPHVRALRYSVIHEMQTTTGPAKQRLKDALAAFDEAHSE
jgi:hypothetical protein